MEKEREKPESSNGDKLNQSGTGSSAGGTEDILGPDGDKIRNNKDKVIGNNIATDNEGRVTQRSNTDI